MANEKRLIDANALKDDFRRYMADRYDRERCVSEENCITCGRVCLFQRTINNAPTVDAVEVVHGRWEKCGGDLHSSGYAVYCSVCNKNHFVHYEYSLGGLCGHKELFEKPKYCPSCGAVMEVEE